MELCIISNGLRSPTGLSAAMSIANVLAGISRISRTETIIDKSFKPVSLGIAEYIGQSVPNTARFIDLLIPSIKEAIQVLIDHQALPEKLPLLLGLPRERPGLERTLESELALALSHLESQVGIGILPEFIRRDHDAGMVGFIKAEEICQSNPNDFVLVAGIDSFVSEETIAWLEQSQQLNCTGNKFGFTPGEAAACCLVCAEATAHKLQLPIRAKIVHSTTALEPTFFDDSSINAGRGLSEAMTTVLESLPDDEQIQEIVCTLKGQRSEAQEFGMSTMGIGKRLSKPGEYVSLNSRWGDIGAASGPALVCYVMEKKALEFEEAGYSLIFTIPPGGYRSAALIQTL